MALGYSLTNHYAGQGLLDSFSFFTGNDPSHGFVDYQSKENALAKDLVSVGFDYNNVRLGVDSNNTYSTSDKGRPSVRLTSHDVFTHGLFIADIYHMPASTCGTWPAFWAFNNQDNTGDSPAGGEIDIIEGANTAQRNLYSAHTTAGCHAPKAGFVGQQGTTDCSLSSENVGCNYASPSTDTTSYGDAFNAEGGGVYAMLWESQDLKLWHFPRSTIPDNIVYAHVVGPDPSSWGPPQAIFGGSSCDTDAHFFNLSLVFNINFCGDYAGNIWGKADQCDQLAPTCEEFVAGSPGSFQGTYWDINFIDVYQYGQLSNMTIPPASSETTSSSLSHGATPVPSGVTPTHTRTVTLSTAPTPTHPGPVDPSAINGYTHLGCFGSTADFHTFSRLGSYPDMDTEDCVARCAGRKYAGIHDDTCYCADRLGDASALEPAVCDIPCPGNGHEMCGGHANPNHSPEAPISVTRVQNSTHATNSSSPHHHRRAGPVGVLLTVYGNLDAEPVPVGAPAMGGHPAPTTVTTALTVTYTTVCSTNPATLVEVEYCTTVTYENCGCTASKATSTPKANYPTGPMGPSLTTTLPPTLPTVPMTTCTETCSACGPHGESTVTLTVPVAVVTEVVTAVSVQTVVPILRNSASISASPAPTNGTAVYTFTSAPTPSLPPANPGKVGGSGSNDVPFAAAAAPRSPAMTIARTLGYGLALWFGLFGAMLIV
ncbi:glycoside hydrolase family 16 protein [Hypomontagnella submonticulosa]|nr:glycoside hydrolase family 16 protein [Hypomontagnella submonticulosa]